MYELLGRYWGKGPADLETAELVTTLGKLEGVIPHLTPPRQFKVVSGEKNARGRN